MENKANREKGAVTIVEAAFVFPIVFFIVFFMIMAGEAYYQQACVEYYLTTAGVDGAARCENPMLATVISSGVPTDPTATDVMPYRYILTGEARSIASRIRDDLEEKIDAMQPLLFHNMKPENVDVTVDTRMNPFVSSLHLNCKFDVPFPIKMIFTGETVKFSYNINLTTSIGDPSEFVRNIAFIADLMEQSQVVTDFCEKLQEGLSKIGQYIN